MPAEREQIKGVVIYPFTVAAVITLLLQVVNAVKLAQAWPFFLVLVLAIAFAFQQFILLVQMGLRDADHIFCGFSCRTSDRILTLALLTGVVNA